MLTFGRNMKVARLINEFICKLDVRKSWDIHENDFTHLFEVNNVTNVSTIDYFFWNSSADGSESTRESYIYQTTSQSLSRVLQNESTPRKQTLQTHRHTHVGNWQMTQKLGFYNELQSKIQRLDVPLFVTDCTNVYINRKLIVY